jgi:cytochrome P450
VKNSTNLDVLIGFNMFVTVIQVFKRFPLLSPFQLLFVPLAKLKSFTAVEERTRIGVKERIDKRGKTEHLDFVEFVLPADSPLPTNRREFTHLGAVAVQFMFANFGPTSDWFYSTIYYLLEEHEFYKLLVEEIRNAFERYEDMTPEALISLPYLYACLEESLRLFNSNSTGLPRICPGAMIDGQYIPKGVKLSPQTRLFLPALSHSIYSSFPPRAISRF